MEKARESLGSRLGFILLSAGCAIGLGNVWRFPYVTGQYGGAAFVLLYLFFLVAFGLPILVAEFSVGRGSRQSISKAFNVLEPKGTKWHLYSNFGMAGNYLLMMFYTVVAGWMVYYFFATLKGDLSGLSTEGVGEYFSNLTASPEKLITWMMVVIVFGFGICFLGLQNGVERITKVMMSGLLVIMIGLAFYVSTLSGAGSGYEFYLKPDFQRFSKNGLWEAIYAAMGQSFFTLSLGIGSMEIFGSYIDKKHTLAGEAVRVMALDTFVAIFSGLIIFPACFAKGQTPDAGAGLVLVTLPNVFNSMGEVSGRIVGSLFFLFMSFAALSTVIAVFENIVAFPMDKYGWSRSKSVFVNLILVSVLSLPCALGMNVLSDVKIIGLSIDGFEDFLVSNNLLPIGSIVFILFCVTKKGWGWENFTKEANTGDGIKFITNKAYKIYLKYFVPSIVILIFIFGYMDIFRKKPCSEESPDVNVIKETEIDFQEFKEVSELIGKWENDEGFSVIFPMKDDYEGIDYISFCFSKKDVTDFWKSKAKGFGMTEGEMLNKKNSYICKIFSLSENPLENKRFEQVGIKLFKSSSDTEIYKESFLLIPVTERKTFDESVEKTLEIEELKKLLLISKDKNFIGIKKDSFFKYLDDFDEECGGKDHEFFSELKMDFQTGSYLVLGKKEN